MPEFTGERVIPGLVDTDLLNEHLARYRFAARFAQGGAVLDAGCGSGYGTAEFSDARSVTATDLSADAVLHAKENFTRPGVRFAQAACEALPFADASFDLVVAFEVIEHLERWRDLLREARRVLKHQGIFLVSTPNKAYYAESRVEAGPNPFHCHEFEYAEFETALYEIFPHVRIWAQNHAESIVFATLNPTGATLEAAGDPAPERANFFLAACSQHPIESNEVYAWLPETGNLLREREHHIAKLEGELEQKNVWLEKLADDHARLQHAHEQTLAELKRANEWAESLNQQIRDRIGTIVRLQREDEKRLQWIGQLQTEVEQESAEIRRLEREGQDLRDELASRTEWVRSIEAELEVRTLHVQIQTRYLEEKDQHLQTQANLLEEQAQHLERLERLREERRLIAGSRWIRLGRKLNLGPILSDEQHDGE